MEMFDSAVKILTAMITPAVLISACGAMILSTSLRLGRVADRVRALSEKLEDFSHSTEKEITHRKERLRAIFGQLGKLTKRARILQRAIIIFYATLGTFVATSVSIGIVAALGAESSWLPLTGGIAGACLLFFGSVTLIYEARLALETINAEMDFVWHLAKFHAPEEFEEHAAQMQPGDS